MLNSLSGPDTVVWDIALLSIPLIGLVFFLLGKKIGAEKKAGKPIILGQDRIPERLKAESFRINGVIWCGWSNDNRRCIIVCLIVGKFTSSEIIIFDKWIKRGEEWLLKEGNIFQLSEKGGLVFKQEPKGPQITI